MLFPDQNKKIADPAKFFPVPFRWELRATD
jgi:hypothetical protein